MKRACSPFASSLPPPPPSKNMHVNFHRSWIGLQWRGSKESRGRLRSAFQTGSGTSRTSAARTDNIVLGEGEGGEGGEGGGDMNVLSKTTRKTVETEKCARHHVCTVSVFFFFFLSEGLNRIGEFVFECLQVCSGLTACTFLFYF